MHPNLYLARATSFSTLDSVFAATVALGFAFALLMVLTSGRFPAARLLRGRRPWPRRLFGKAFTEGKVSLWHSIPGAIPVSIGSFLIGFGLSGLALRSLPLTEAGRLLLSGAFGTLFGTLFLTFVAHYFGGGAKEETGSALIGALARISLEIPANGAGRITFEKGGRRGTLPARSHDGRAMPTGCLAFVVGIQAGIALVEEL